MTGEALVSIPRTDTSWFTSEGLRSRITFTSARLKGFEETLTSAGAAPVRPATTCLASSSSSVITSEGNLSNCE